MEFSGKQLIRHLICKSQVLITAVSSLAHPLAHRRNVVSLSIFYRHHFGRCSSELAELVLLPYS